MTRTERGLLRLDRHEYEHDGAMWPYLVWSAGPGWRMVASTVVGGGIGVAGWVLNARVPPSYARTDPDRHVLELARVGGLVGRGVGMLTAADLDRVEYGDDGGAEVAATVGMGRPAWAAAPESGVDRPAEPEPVAYRPGTINILAAVPVPLTDAALVNAVITVTEAKTQALLDAGFSCTGTASDAVCVAARVDGAAEEAFAGPRSTWGARLARAAHTAVHRGASRWVLDHGWPTAPGIDARVPASVAVPVPRQPSG